MSGLSPFEWLDEQATAAATGYTLVHGPRALLGSLARHLGRRTRAASRKLICIDGAQLDDPWRELVRSLRLEAMADPATVARSLLTRVGRSAVVLCAPEPTRWGAAVADELAQLASAHRIDGWIVELTPGRFCPHASPIAVTEHGSEQELERWWQALWQAERQDGRLARVDRIDQAERWWWAARSTADRTELELSAEARSLWARLGLLRRRVAPEQQRELGSTAARDELSAQGRIVMDEQGFALPLDASPAPTSEDSLVAAEWLARSGDSWDRMRAAELLIDAGELGRAGELAQAALQDVRDACARADLWNRWERALGVVDRPAAGEVLQRFSELALELGDVEPAFALAQQAASAAGGRRGYEVLLCLGRATAGRGEHAAAAQALEQAMQQAQSRSDRARAEVELAEVCCATGETARAQALAESALGQEPALETRFAARNVLGKLLLAARRWREAEQHFAADAHQAACHGGLEPQLRAQLNQATALVMGGRRREAEACFEAVLEAAEPRGERRATAFALSNLAVLACHDHDYARALGLRERSLRVFLRIGNRTWLARSMTYLADLRVDLGLVEEAEQALAFAQRVLGPVRQPTQAAWMGYVASRIHLAKGDTAKAATAILDASSSAARSTDGTIAGECGCQAARVALAEGDAEGAARHIEQARQTVCSPAGQAELALLDAGRAAAAGEPFEAQARAAYEQARRTGDRARTARALLLLHQHAASRGDGAQARRQLDAADEIHEAIASSLPQPMAERYRAQQARSGMMRRANASDRPQRDTRKGSQVDMVGAHPSMRRLLQVIEKVAPTQTTVLICGESGTGKELVADAIHRHSQRRDGPLLKVNCAALVETLLLSELFGHEKGAFTGASSQRRGCFENAGGGTIFLDEIGDVSTSTQAALLRVLQDHTFQRVGGTELVRVDVRVVCATHRDLANMVKSGSFREDLYYRLRGVVLEVPPLRERPEDLPLLCADILLRIAREQQRPLKRLAPDALALLADHDWPGNVRELQNALRAAALFVDGATITAVELGRHVSGLRHLAPAATRAAPSTRRSAGEAEDPTEGGVVANSVSGGAVASAGGEAVSAGGEAASAPGAEELVYAAVREGEGLRDLQKRLEYHCVVRALRETNGHVTRAAALLGIKRPRLSQLIKEFNLKSTSEVSR